MFSHVKKMTKVFPVWFFSCFSIFISFLFFSPSLPFPFHFIFLASCLQEAHYTEDCSSNPQCKTLLYYYTYCRIYFSISQYHFVIFLWLVLSYHFVLLCFFVFVNVLLLINRKSLKTNEYRHLNAPLKKQLAIMSILGIVYLYNSKEV